ncbi:ABC transporter substrate-binding protein [Pseudomonas sp. NPDC089530]|uniref:ABC transporter substrate-binding protein n=1 Tax=Pseudomonas sp. NPDC089530 TaxID=3390651 RepID=UPI003CFE632F
MSKALNRCLLVLLLVLSAPFWAAAHATSVVFLNPGKSTEAFWIGYSQFMQTAASDLGLDLRVRYSQRDSQTTIRQAREALQGPHRPDYLVVANEQYVAPEILRLSRGSGVKLFIVNNALTADQQRLLGERQSRYPDWIGSMVANDEEAGYRMLKELIRQRGPLAEGQFIDLLAFSGVKNTPVAQLREQGLQRALAEHPQVRLRQMVYGEWSRQRAFEQAQQLLKRYPQTQLIWSANDEMALGAMAAVEQRGRQPGKDVLFSALNSSSQALKALIDGRLTTLIAGHFTLGGWAMVVLNDDARGLTPTALGGPDWQLDVFQVLDKAQAQRLLELQDTQHYGVDFRALSAEGKPAGYRYPFSLDLLLH